MISRASLKPVSQPRRGLNVNKLFQVEKYYNNMNSALDSCVANLRSWCCRFLRECLLLAGGLCVRVFLSLHRYLCCYGSADCFCNSWRHRCLVKMSLWCSGASFGCLDLDFRLLGRLLSGPLLCPTADRRRGLLRLLFCLRALSTWFQDGQTRKVELSDVECPATPLDVTHTHQSYAYGLSPGRSGGVRAQPRR